MIPAASIMDIDEAARRIAEGGVVAFPTETVYGLGASAFDPAAVRRIFELKGRPADNPLIVHLASVDWLDRVAVDVPDAAYRLFEKFSPGPLTLVLKKNLALPDLVSAGLPTVAVRIPDHPTALALLRAADLPLVAPSANLSGTPSPTTAAHVLHDFADLDVAVLDGGPCAIGIESTVLDMTVNPPAILRPGHITAQAIGDRTGLHVIAGQSHASKPKSPGQKYRHYAPQAVVLPVLPGASFDAAAEGLAGTERARIGVFADASTIAALNTKGLVSFSYGDMPSAERAAQSLYAALRHFDAAGAEVILVPLFNSAESAAYNDRVTRAASPLSRVLFVCTGNTCRSPMAEVLFNRHAPPGWRASSAGVAAFDGEPAAAHAQAVMAARGLDLSGHRATRVSKSLLGHQSLVVPLTENHADMLLSLDSRLSGNMIILSDLTPDKQTISDPFGDSLAAYERSADQIERAVLRLVASLTHNPPSGT